MLNACDFQAPVINTLLPCTDAKPSGSILIERSTTNTNEYVIGIKDGVGIKTVKWLIDGKAQNKTAIEMVSVSVNGSGDTPISATLLNGCGDSLTVSSTLSVFPEISSISPLNGGIDDVVTITGKNFTSNLNDVVVELNGKVIKTVFEASASQLKLLVPVDMGSGKFKVTIKNKSVTATQGFEYTTKQYVESINMAIPSGFEIYDVAFASDNKLYYCGFSSTNAIIGRVSTDGTNEILTQTSKGYQDGSIASARFFTPFRLVTSGDDIYVLDNEKGTSPNCEGYMPTVRKIDKSLQVSTVFRNATTASPCYSQDLAFNPENNQLILFDGQFHLVNPTTKQVVSSTAYINDSKLLLLGNGQLFNLVQDGSSKWLIQKRNITSPFNLLDEINAGLNLRNDNVITLSMAYDAANRTILFFDKDKLYRINVVTNILSEFYSKPQSGSNSSSLLSKHLFGVSPFVAIHPTNGGVYILDLDTGTWKLKRILLK